MNTQKKSARALSGQSVYRTAVGITATVFSLFAQPAVAENTSREPSVQSRPPVYLDYQDAYIKYHETPSLETLLDVVEPERLDDSSYAIIAEHYSPEPNGSPFLESVIDTAQELYEPYLTDEPNGTSDFFSYLFALRQELARLPDAEGQLGFDLQEEQLLYTREDHLDFYQSLDDYLNDQGFFLNIITAPLDDGRSALSVYLGEMVYEKTEIIQTMRDIIVSDTRFVRNLEIKGYYLSNDSSLSTTGWTDFFRQRIYLHLDDITGQSFSHLDEFREFRHFHEAEHIAQYNRRDRGDLYTLEAGAITANLVLTDTFQHDINRIYSAYYDRRGFTTEPYRTIYEEIVSSIASELGYTRENIQDGSYSEGRIRNLAQSLYENVQ